ncbi:MAG: hypothetical protein ACRDQJ_20485 [Pseudonocardiaceae bacterium]
MDDEIGAGRESSDDLTPYQRTFDVIEADKHELLVVAERNGEVIGTLQLSLLLGLPGEGLSAHRFYEKAGFTATHEGLKLTQRLISQSQRAERSWRRFDL